MRGTAYLIITNVSPTSWSAKLSKQRQVAGRAPDVDIVVPQAYRSVSRRHAEVWQDDRARWIRDLGSRGGTQVNGVWLEPKRDYQITTGDRVQLGSLELMLVRNLELGDAVAPEPDSGRHPPPLQESLRRQLSKTAPLPPEFLIGRLTHAEREVVLWIGRGCTDLNEIGRKLFRSPNTVRTQLNSIYKKLGVHSRDELMGWIRRSSIPDASDGG
jgi:DNA-binding CsgD family transcriptional regulator